MIADPPPGSVHARAGTLRILFLHHSAGRFLIRHGGRIPAAEGRRAWRCARRLGSAAFLAGRPNLAMFDPLTLHQACLAARPGSAARDRY